jgi:hypothetical protein
MLRTAVLQILGATVQNEATWLSLSWTLTGAPRNVGKWVQFINTDSSCLIVVVLCFTGVNRLLVERTNLFLVAVIGLKEWRTIVCDITMPGTLLVLDLTVHMLTWHWGSLKVCLIGVQLSTSTYLFYSDVSFPHRLRGGTYADKYEPLDNRHPVSKGWICVVGTEDCLVLRNPSHRLRKGGMLRCRGFWWLGESQTLYKEVYSWNVCVCVCARSEFTALKHEVHPQQDMDMYLQFSQSVVYVSGISFCLGMLSLTLGRVFSKSLSYKISCSDSFIVVRRL